MLAATGSKKWFVTLQGKKRNVEIISEAGVKKSFTRKKGKKISNNPVCLVTQASLQSLKWKPNAFQCVISSDGPPVDQRGAQTNKNPISALGSIKSCWRERESRDRVKLSSLCIHHGRRPHRFTVCSLSRPLLLPLKII